MTMDKNVTEQLLDWVRNHYFGKYRGTVTDNSDSTNRGRLKVRVPAVLADQEVWAMPCLPYTGDGVGSYWIPESGAGVWVEFEAGDPSYPIWTGGFWADDELPEDQQGTAATPSLRILRSKQGLMVSLDDDAETLTLSDKDGNNLITVSVDEGEIKIQASQKVVIQAPAIQLVEDSTHPVVFGDILLQFIQDFVVLYQTHAHPFIGSPPVPQPQLPQALQLLSNLLSNTVTTG